MSTRTAPAFTAAANARQISLGLIDASGDLYSVSLPVPVAATAAQIEAIADNYALSSQASLYSITDTLLRTGDADPDNADTGQRNSVKDGINLLFKDPTTLQTFPLRIIAPNTGALQGNQDIPLLTYTPVTDLIVATLAVFTTYAMASAQYTERRERRNNPRVK